MLKRKMDTNQKICKLLDTGHNTLRMEQIVVTDLSSDDWNVISKEVNDKIIYIEFCINRILKLETITFSTTSSILSKIVLRFEEVLRILSLLKLDLVYEQVHQFVDHFEQLSSELEKGIDSRISFNFLNHFISTESKSFLSNFNDIVDCMLSSTFVGRGRFGNNKIYDIRRVNVFRLNKKMTSIYYSSKNSPEKIICKYTKFKEQIVEHSGQNEILHFFINASGEIIAYFYELGIYSNIYRFGESVSKTFDFLYNYEGGDNVPYAICFENKLYVTHLDSDIRDLSSLLEEKKGFYWVPGEEKPFFMAAMDVKKSRFYENIDLSLGKNRQDSDFGYRKTLSLKKIGYPYSYESFGFEKIKFSVKSEGVCLIKIGFHSFPVIDSNVDVDKEPFPLMEIASSSNNDTKSSYVSLPINLGKHNVRFLKSERGHFYILSKDFIYESKGIYFKKKKNNVIVNKNIDSLGCTVEISRSKKNWTLIEHEQTTYTFSTSLFTKLMNTYSFRINSFQQEEVGPELKASSLSSESLEKLRVLFFDYSVVIGKGPSEELYINYDNTWIKMDIILKQLNFLKDTELDSRLSLYEMLSSAI
ncbi:hypothetical protein HOG98_05470 [bacterium]|jgi:hypothetical protein|nr:hypothetical protein [bacterium]